MFKKNCCFITMCKAHSKVTHIKQQKKYFHHLKGRGYNKNSVLYPGRIFHYASAGVSRVKIGSMA